MIHLRFLWRKHGKSNYKNGWYGDCMETGWRATFYEVFMNKLVWTLSEVFMEKTWVGQILPALYNSVISKDMDLKFGLLK